MKQDTLSFQVVSEQIQKMPSLVLTGLVSSGKSTLANALIGKAFLPTSNLVCTASAITIYDDMHICKDSAAAYMCEGERFSMEEEGLCQIIRSTNKLGGKEIYVQAPLNRLNHGQFPVAILDTPGVNDSEDAKYGAWACKKICQIPNPIVLYITHIQYCGTTDEEKCLQNLAKAIQKRRLSTWYVVINGWNFTDMEYDLENRMHYREKIEWMTEKCGLPKPEIFFVSAFPAELCGRMLHGGQISRSEFIKLEEYLKNIGLYERARENQYALGKISNKTLRKAMYQTGVQSLSQAIFQYIRNLQRERKNQPDEDLQTRL